MWTSQTAHSAVVVTHHERYQLKSEWKALLVVLRYTRTYELSLTALCTAAQAASALWKHFRSSRDDVSFIPHWLSHKAPLKHYLFTTCSPGTQQVFLLVDERLTGRAHSSAVSKSPPLPAMMLWLCGFRLQTVNKRRTQFPAVQNEASAFFWMSSRWRLLWPSSLIIWSWWVHGLSRCFQVSLNATQCWLFCSH